MPVPPRRTVQLEAFVRAARGLVSSKGEGEPCTTTAQLTLLGGEPVTSEEVAESSEPEYACSTLHTFKADDASCMTLLSTPLTVSILEGARRSRAPRHHNSHERLLSLRSPQFIPHF